MPVPVRHRWTPANMVALNDASPEAGPRYEVIAGEESRARPDVIVVPLDEALRLETEMPARVLSLVIEVLSPPTAYSDRGPKRELYQRHVPEYWIVDLDARLVERWRRGDDRPEVIRDRIDWHPAGAAAPLILELAVLFGGHPGAGPG